MSRRRHINSDVIRLMSIDNNYLYLLSRILGDGEDLYQAYKEIKPNSSQRKTKLNHVPVRYCKELKHGI